MPALQLRHGSLCTVVLQFDSGRGISHISARGHAQPVTMAGEPDVPAGVTVPNTKTAETKVTIQVGRCLQTVERVRSRSKQEQHRG